MTLITVMSFFSLLVHIILEYTELTLLSTEHAVYHAFLQSALDMHMTKSQNPIIGFIFQ